MSKKYAVFGGHVTSRNDGQRHYVPASRVADLYGVSRQDCYLVNDNGEFGDMLNLPKGLTYLHPDPTGRYKLPG